MGAPQENPVSAIAAKILQDQETSAAMLDAWLASQEGDTFETADAAQERIDTIIALVSNAGFDLIIRGIPATIYVRTRGESGNFYLDKKSIGVSPQQNLGDSKVLPAMSVQAKSDVRTLLGQEREGS